MRARLSYFPDFSRPGSGGIIVTTWIIVGLVLTVLVQHRRIKQLSERLDDTRRESHVFQYETFERLHAVEKDVKRITGGTDTPSGSASCGSGPQVFDV